MLLGQIAIIIIVASVICLLAAFFMDVAFRNFKKTSKGSSSYKDVAWKAMRTQELYDILNSAEPEYIKDQARKELNRRQIINY
jgi:hypothetical protein